MEPLKFTLIEKFALRHPTIDSIRKHFELLKLKGEWNVGLLDSRHIMIKLSNDEDHDLLFAKKLYLI